MTSIGFGSKSVWVDFGFSRPYNFRRFCSRLTAVFLFACIQKSFHWRYFASRTKNWKGCKQQGPAFAVPESCNFEIIFWDPEYHTSIDKNSALLAFIGELQTLSGRSSLRAPSNWPSCVIFIRSSIGGTDTSLFATSVDYCRFLGPWLARNLNADASLLIIMVLANHIQDGIVLLNALEPASFAVSRYSF